MAKALDKYERRARSVHSLLCVGLDSDYERLPAPFREQELPQFSFNRWIIEQTHDYCSAYKLNIAFYEARGKQGIHELKLTADYLCERHPDIFTICDAKRGDIGTTSRQYATAIFDQLGFDAVTLQPYLGRDALEPFLNRADNISIILCRTSNPGSGELQCLEVNDKPLWQIVAERVCNVWNANENCMLVVGATYPEELQRVRSIVGDMTLLVPGIGTQGGNVEQVVQAGLNSQKLGLIINSSRGIIFANDLSLAARNLRDAINQCR